MGDLRASTTVGETEVIGSVGVEVTVRYWAAARAAAGRSEDHIEDVATVQQALDGARRLHSDDDRFDQVLAISSVLLGDRPVQRDRLDDVPVSAGDVIEVLPPFAGG